jgi:purine-binding chemotaxis protein CheW
MQAVENKSYSDSKQEMQVVAFQLGLEEYAVDIINVQEIIKLHKVTRIPRTEPYVEGVINLRGNIIPLFNLHTKFKLPARGSSEDQRIIVFQLDDIKAAIIVDKVSEVLHINTGDIEATDHVYQGMNASHINGIAKIEDRILILLNIYKILINDNIR